ncbi:MAG: LysM peptidoglycan-binding domain-containing protein [Christensenellales bacterium]
MRRYRVSSKIRFSIFLAFIAVLILSTYMAFVGVTDAQGDTVERYEIISVNDGDSLWTLAKNHVPKDMDIREYVYHVAKYNDVDPGDLNPGEKIKLPIY